MENSEYMLIKDGMKVNKELSERLKDTHCITNVNKNTTFKVTLSRSYEISYADAREYVYIHLLKEPTLDEIIMGAENYARSYMIDETTERVKDFYKFVSATVQPINK